MKIVKGNPPNIDVIRLAGMVVDDNSVFCYNDIIFVPSGKELSPDIEYHERIHSEQQDGKAEQWWNRYLLDLEFRKEQEVEAFAEQYKFVKKNLPVKVSDELLEEISQILASNLYGLKITKYQANTLIRYRLKI